MRPLAAALLLLLFGLAVISYGIVGIILIHRMLKRMSVVYVVSARKSWLTVLIGAGLVIPSIAGFVGCSIAGASWNIRGPMMVASALGLQMLTVGLAGMYEVMKRDGT